MQTNYRSKRKPHSPFPYHPDKPESWWSQLPPDFHKHTELFDLSAWDKIRIESVSFTDICFRSFIAVMFSLSNIRYALQLANTDYKSLWGFYRQLHKTPEKFFRRNTKSVQIEMTEVPSPFRFPGGAAYDIEFDSPFTPVHPDQADLYDRLDHPPHACARLYAHRTDKKRPTVVLLHGFVVNDYHTNSVVFDVERLYKLGFNVLLYTKPYHGTRRTPWGRYSGDGFISVNVSKINENMAFSIHDLRIFLDFLRDRGTSAIGLSGLSLGGYHTSLMAGIEDDLAFAVPIVPVTSLIDLSLEWEPMSTLIRSLMKIFKHDMDEVREYMAVHSPLSYAPKIPKDHLFIVAGIGDRMSSPKQSRLLWEHWGKPDIHWFVGNHLIHLERKIYYNEIESFLRKIGLAKTG